jgi:hypothetical protein
MAARGVRAVAAVIFSDPVSDISFAWATAGGVSFIADIFDSADVVLGTFLFDGSGSAVNNSGTAGFAFGSIARLEFHDGSQAAAIDTLPLEVPEPAALALLGAGLLGLGALRRRRSQAWRAIALAAR